MAHNRSHVATLDDTHRHEGRSGAFTAPHQTMMALIWKDFRHHPMALVGLSILGTIALASLFAFLSPYNPEGVDTANRFASPSLAHPMGTDRNGRDILTRVLYGGRISLTVGIAAMATAIALGGLVGSLAGYYGGFTDNFLMRFTDFALSFPNLFVLILLSVLIRESEIPLLGSGIASIALVIGLTSWMSVARLVRATFLTIKTQDFVTAAHAGGSSSGRIILRHILPNAAGPIIVNGTMGVAWAILIESGLSFLGYGVQPPTPSWGNILNDAQQTLSLYPWIAVFPGTMIFLTVVSINFIGDALRDALDPFRVVRQHR
jgi:peptide/nickel transport system permease protein